MLPLKKFAARYLKRKNSFRGNLDSLKREIITRQLKTLRPRWQKCQKKPLPTRTRQGLPPLCYKRPSQTCLEKTEWWHARPRTERVHKRANDNTQQGHFHGVTRKAREHSSADETPDLYRSSGGATWLPKLSPLQFKCETRCCYEAMRQKTFQVSISCYRFHCTYLTSLLTKCRLPSL